MLSLVAKPVNFHAIPHRGMKRYTQLYERTQNVKLSFSPDKLKPKKDIVTFQLHVPLHGASGISRYSKYAVEILKDKAPFGISSSYLQEQLDDIMQLLKKYPEQKIKDNNDYDLMRRLSYVYENLHDVHKKCGLWSSDDYKVKEYRQHVKNIYTLIRTYQSYVNATTAGYDFPFPVDIKLFDEVLLSESVKSTVYNVENKFEHLLIDNNKMVYYHDGHLYIDIPPYTTQPIVGKMSHQEMISAWADINDFSLKEYYTTPWDTISVSYKDEKKNLLRTDYFYVQKNNESAVKVRKVGITRISLYVGEQNKFHWLGSSSFIEGVD